MLLSDAGGAAGDVSGVESTPAAAAGGGTRRRAPERLRRDPLQPADDTPDHFMWAAKAWELGASAGAVGSLIDLPANSA